MMQADPSVTPAALAGRIETFWALSARKLEALFSSHDVARGAPVVTVEGRYVPREWTAWTEGFLYGSALLQFDATGETPFLETGRTAAVERMEAHLTHFGVHDHGFNNVSTFGNLLRLLKEGRWEAEPWEERYYSLALKCSAAVQARRWTAWPGGTGYIYSFNGPHSLFIDTLRSLRSLALGHQLGHVLMDEQDQAVSLLNRLVQHAETTAKFAVYYGEGRDAYDVPGRVAHESLFNVNNGQYRCPNSQQGYSPFTTWTRGLAWALLGFTEQLEFLESLAPFPGREVAVKSMLRAARATADYYLEQSAADGIPYWDTGAPGLSRMPGYLDRPADPFNEYEPVDSSAAAIAAQGLLRLAHVLGESGRGYGHAGLTMLSTLLDEPYLGEDERHDGLLLHSVYHRPNGWDYVPPGRKVPCGEASMWGDYHLRELALYVQRLDGSRPYLTFFGGG